jgi:hypothetical protein
MGSVMTAIALWFAAVLVVGVSVVHSWLGEVRIISPLLALEPRQGVLRSAFTRQVIRYAWHLTSLAWSGMGAALAALAFMPPSPAGRIAVLVIAVTFLLHGVIVLAISRGRHLAWPIFLVIATLCVFAAR